MLCTFSLWTPYPLFNHILPSFSGVNLILLPLLLRISANLISPPSLFLKVQTLASCFTVNSPTPILHVQISPPYSIDKSPPYSMYKYPPPYYICTNIPHIQITSSIYFSSYAYNPRPPSSNLLLLTSFYY